MLTNRELEQELQRLQVAHHQLLAAHEALKARVEANERRIRALEARFRREDGEPVQDAQTEPDWDDPR